MVYRPGFALDYPGAAMAGKWSAFATVSGNRLVAGGHGVTWGDNCTNALVLKNDFAAATLRALDYSGTNGAAGTITVLKNTLNQGLGGHLRPRYGESSGYFLLRNHYRANGSTNDVNPFLDLPDSPVHFVH